MRNFTKQFVLFITLLTLATEVNAQVKIGENPTTINKASLLELEHANKGLLFPRVNLTNTTTWSLTSGSTPVAGMMVYNIKTSASGFSGTASYPAIAGDGTGIYYWDGNGWVAAKGVQGADGKSVTGAAGAPGATTPGNAGDTYINTLTGDTYIKQGNTWVLNGNIRGAKGDTGTNGTNGLDGKSVTGAPGNPGATTPGNTGDTYINTTTGETFVYNGTTWVSNGSIKGPKGDTGTNGLDGKSVTGAPGNPGATTPGNTGDTYINTTTGETFVYNGTTWVSNGNIKGPKGDTGTDGKSVTGAPGNPGATTPGNTGDTYINTTTGETFVYNGTTWVSNGSIKGPKGDTGTNGTKGADGKSVTGAPGNPGATTPGNTGDTYINTTTGETFVYNGTTWVSNGNIKGPKGDTGTNGLDGKSVTGSPGNPGATTPGNTGDTYINTTTGETFVYNGTTWVSNGNIKGPKGDTGTNGLDGKSVTGAPGNPGTTTPGNAGDTYINTTTGETFVYNGTTWVSNGNIKGPKGDTGAQGPKGDTGTNGTSVTSGTTLPASGATGDTFINTNTGETFVYNGTTWVSNGNIKGPKGDTGSQGLKGDTGATGPKGDTGTQGLQGLKGETGATGPKGDTGAQGLQGLKGDTGAVGATGATGPKGDTGTQGLQGLKGDTGAVGATGATGPKGDTGTQGLQGLKGDTGATGPKGDTGSQGLQGLKGDTGAVGATGATGPKGDTGTQGLQGLKGDTGATGPKGDTGAQGLQGPKGDTGTKGSDDITANNGLTKTTTNIQLGGALVKSTVITTGGIANTLAVAGLQTVTPASADKIVIADANGVLKQAIAFMPSFFYMPSVVIPTAADQFTAEPGVSGESFGTINLHGRYAKQFGTPVVSSTGAPALPVLTNTQLNYYITWYDTNVFQNVTVSATGILSYTIKANADVSVGSFMNIVFGVK